MSKVDNPNGGYYYMDNRLNTELDKQIKAVNVKDKDRVFIVDGAEGSGKSVFAQQLAAKVDPSFTIDRIVFTPQDFIKAIKNGKRGQAIVFDEAFTGMSSRTALSKMNNLILRLMMEMRQKNLIVFIVMPSFFLLERYQAIFRSTGLFHIYTKNGKRGFFVYFNKRKKLLLYLNGKHTFSYSGKNIPRSGFRGRFLERYTVDEKAYRKLKSNAFNFEEVTYNNPILDDRNKLLKLIKDEFKISYRDMEALLDKYGVSLSYSQISKGVRSVD